MSDASSTAQPRSHHDGHPEPTKIWTKGGPVDSAYVRPDEVAAIEERAEASVALPAPMALFGFAVGTFIIAWPLSGFIATSDVLATVAPVLVFAGIAQFIGGLVALRRGNTFAGTAFCAYGANNTVVAVFFLLMLSGALAPTPGSPGMKMLALELYCFAYISIVLAARALKLNSAFVSVLVALVPGFTMSAMGSWYGDTIPGWVGHIGGYCLIASAAFAAYSATAMVLNSTWQRPVLPMFGHMRQAAAQ